MKDSNNYMGVWPDGTCVHSDDFCPEEFAWKSDDYCLVPIADYDEEGQPIFDPQN